MPRSPSGKLARRALPAPPLILDDEESRFALCDYMLAGQLINDDTVCKQRYVHAVPRFAIESEDLQYRNLSSDGNSVNVPIRCKK